MTPEEKQHSAALMRINHCGEVSAQALYLGQSLVTRNPALAKQLQRAAEEEQAHLRWCRERIQTLGGRRSFLNPLWAVGSFGIGVVAGLLGDKVSLGFLAETEEQVTRHLDKHLQEISPHDHESRKILLKMKEDEQRHATHAVQLGGTALPKPICLSMTLLSKVMTTLSRYI